MTTDTAPSPGLRSGRSLTLIDTDVHHAPDHQEMLKRMPAALRKRGWVAPGSVGYRSPIGVDRSDAVPPQGGQPGSDPDYLLEHHFDRYGIDYGVLHPAGTLGLGVSADYRYAAAACSAYNDYMIETWLQHTPGGERFLGALLVAPQWPDAAAAEIRRVGGHPKMKQVIMCSAARIPFGNAYYWPIYEAAEEMGLPVAVHPGAEGNGISGPATSAGYPSSYFEWHTSLSQNYMAHLTSLVCEGVFQRFPGLIFVAVEGGIAWLPHLMWRLDKNWKALRELAPWLTEPPSQVIRQHVRLTSQPIEEPEKPEHLLQIFEMMHAGEVLMYSSDYPHWDFDDPKHAFPKLSQDLADRIFFKNAADLYQLNPQEPSS